MLGPMSRINHLRVMYKKILNYIIKLLDEKPGLPVKEIAKKCRQEFKNDLLTAMEWSRSRCIWKLCGNIKKSKSVMA